MVTSLSYLSSSSMPVLMLLLAVLPYVFKYAKLCMVWLKNAIHIATALRKFPSPHKHWLRGHLHQIQGFNEAGTLWFRDCVKKYPRAMCLWMGPCRPDVCVYHPETCKLVLRSSFPKPTMAKTGYAFMKAWIGDGLVLSSGEKWHRNRQLLAASFHFESLARYFTAYNNTTDTLLDKLQLATDKGDSIDIFQHTALFTLDTILQTAFSYNMDVQRMSKNHPYTESVNQMLPLVVKRTLNPLLYLDCVYKLLPYGWKFTQSLKQCHAMTRDLIEKRKQRMKVEQPGLDKEALDILDILMLAKDENGTGLSNKEITDEVDALLLAGTDTSSSVIAWTLFTLSQNLNDKETCYQEISRLLDGRKNDYIEWADFRELPYLTMCMNEAMRLHTPIPVIGRQVDKEIEIEGVTVPAGTVVNIALQELHHNEEVWGEDHDVFKPERFSQDNMKQMDPFAFLPFGAGQRNCLGQKYAMNEIKVVLARILYRFQLSVDTTQHALHESFMRAENGLHLFIKQRPASL